MAAITQTRIFFISDLKSDGFFSMSVSELWNSRILINLLIITTFFIQFEAKCQVWKIDNGFEFEDAHIGIYSDLYDYTQVFYDSSGKLAYPDVISGDISFEKNNTKSGFQANGIYWIKATIQGSTQKDGRYLFSIGLNLAYWPSINFSMTTWPFIDLYIQDTDSVRVLKTGFKRKPSEKEIKNGFSYFWLDLEQNQQKTIYARLDPNGGEWSEWSRPKNISIYQYEPSSLDILDNYTLKYFEQESTPEGNQLRRVNLFEIMQIYLDPTCGENFEDIRENWDSKSEFFIGELDDETCYWAHFNIINPTELSQLRIFNFPNAWHRVTCYVPGEHGAFEIKMAGIKTEQAALFLSIPANDTIPIYIKYPTIKKSIYPFLNVQDIYEKDYIKRRSRTPLKFLLLGALILPILYFLIQFITQKDLLTLYYLIFILGSTLYLFSILDQIPYFDLCPKILKTSTQITSFYSIGSLLSLVGVVKFIHIFLDVKSSSLWIHRLGLILLALFAISIAYLHVDFHLIRNNQPTNFGIQLYRLFAALILAYALATNVFGLIKKIKFSKALFFAFSPLLLTGIYYAVIFLLYGINIYISPLDENLVLVGGFILTIILFGVVIGVRNNALKAERIKIQEDMLSLQEKVNQELVKVDALKDQFLANTSHELRTPLQGIIGLSESLQEHEKDKSKKKDLSMITSSGKRLASLVNSILDFSKLKTHELKLSIKAVDIRTIADAVLHICRPLVKSKPVELINKIEASIPLVEADENRLYQILHNLVGNAIKFTTEGGIAISASSKDDMVEVCVQDTGIGIPEDKIDDIFKSFEQVDASITREHGGTGLGLTITKQLIELHGGSIWVESQLDKGTNVSFTLPRSSEGKAKMLDEEKLSRVVDTVENITEENEIQVELSTSVRDSKFTILIVDDEPINQQVLTHHLSSDDFRIINAMNGQEALRLLENDKPDLILLDIMMPKMSGYEVSKEIRKKYLPSELPIIMITAKDQVPDLVEGLASGANDYLAKPFSKDELLARLKTHLNLYHINAAYLRFIPKEFLKALGRESIIDVDLGDQVQGDMTILFTDIRSFTSITEKLSARESFEFLNEFLDTITPCITKHGGFIDKYIGDAVMALYPSRPDDAIVSGIEIQQELSKYNEVRESLNKDKIKIGVGIHTGPLMMGTIGVKDRMDGTVISDAVNLASRLEELNKYYGTSMIVSEQTMDRLSDSAKYNNRFLSFVRVKGKEKATRIFEFFDGDEAYHKEMKLKTLSIFNEGIEEFYSRKFARASVKFQDIIDIYPEDRTSKLFLEKSAQYMVKGVPENWDGVDIVEKVF